MEPRLTQCSQELDSNENQCALESKSQTTQINVEDGRNPCYKRRGRFCNSNAARERSRVKTLRTAFLELQQTLPAVPPDTKLSKLDVLVLATTYICHLMRTLDGGRDKASFSAQGFMHPVKKWPMRTRLYAGILASTQRDGEAGYRGQLTSTDTRADWGH